MSPHLSELSNSLAGRANTAGLSRRGLLKAAGLGGLALGAGSMLAACGGGSSSGASTGALSELSLQLSWIKNYEFVGEYAAAEKGYYRDAGFTTVNLLAGGTSTTAESIVLSGKATVGLSSTPITAAAITSSGAPLKIIGATYQKNPFAIASLADKKPIHTVQDLVGKRIGVQAGGNQTLFEALLKANGIDKSQVQIVGVQYDQTPLKNGSVDGFMTYVINDFKLHLQGYDPVILAFADSGLPFVAETFTVRQDMITNNRDALKKFLVAEIKGWTDAIKDPATAVNYTVDKYGADQKLDFNDQYGSAVEIAEKLIVTDDTNANGLFTMTDQVIANDLKSLSAMGYQLDAKQLYDLSLLTEVYQEHPELKAAITPPTDVNPPKAGK
jgi:ABC-type nitrate/sulfonate/bicarbonate transport system substrate-binding protein